jgi:hypothetical protein
MRLFERYIGIDYSGAQTIDSSLPGLRVYVAECSRSPEEAQPPPSPRRYWTRRGVAEWLEQGLSENIATLVGIDHGFSFPVRYFERHGLRGNWTEFLEDFQSHWPTDEQHTYVDFVREGHRGSGQARSGDPRWRRLTEVRAGAKSVFHFDVPGSVAKSTHAGLPWLLRLQRASVAPVHFWPYDGWQVPPGRSAVVEAYPSLWSRSCTREHRTSHQHDAWSIAEWMRQTDKQGLLPTYFNPPLSPEQRRIADIEGWILGVA